MLRIGFEVLLSKKLLPVREGGASSLLKSVNQGANGFE